MIILKSFIDNSYCNTLSDWILNKEGTDLFQDANMKGNRLTTRYTKKDIIYPQEAFEIRNKIVNHLNFKYFKYAPFTYGMYASIAHKGDTCYLHKDPRHFDNHRTVHCNLKLNDAEGGDVLVEDKTYDVEKGDLWVYPVSEKEHGSNALISDKRLIWVYGFCLYANR